MFLTVLYIPISISAHLCCTLVLINLLKIENIHKRCLRLTLNDYKSDYKTLLDKSGKESMKIRRIKTLAIEILRTVNELKPHFMKTIFTYKTNFRVRPFDLPVNSQY